MKAISNPLKRLLHVRNLVKEHHRLKSRTIPLQAGENIMSPLAREFMTCDFQHRYSSPEREGWYFGEEFIRKVEKIAVGFAKELFNAEVVELHPIGGHMACSTVLLAFTGENDLVMELDEGLGGHSTLWRLSRAGKINLKRIGFLFDNDEMNIDIENVLKTIEETRPKLIMLGATHSLFPHPLREIARKAQEIGAIVAYDASHVLGLIAGKQFQDPLREGALVMQGGTHKTLPGPQGGIILAKGGAEVAEKLKKALHWPLVDNLHAHHIPALAVALAEMLAFGEEYAKQVISNSRTLARALYERKLDVLFQNKGFTESHCFLMGTSNLGGAEACGKLLEEANIITEKTALPWDRARATGIKFGVSEITRLGMKKNEMDEIADLIETTLVKKEKPSSVAEKALTLRKRFRKVHYCFDEDAEAYAYFSLSAVSSMEA